MFKVGTGNIRSRQHMKQTTCTDKKAQESKEDEVMFEKDIVSKKEDNVIADTERTHLRGNREVKSIELFEDDKGHRSVKTT